MRSSTGAEVTQRRERERLIAYGFATLGLTEIVAMTAVGNERSRRVMERVGMKHNAADDFDHPNIVAGHSLRRHVLYRSIAPDRAVVAHE